MRPRLPIRRILDLRPFRPPNCPRPFTQNTLNSQRPQLPFLSPPSRRPTARFLTTERKQWIKDEVWLAGRYTIFLWSSAAIILVGAFGAQQVWLEHQFPAPKDWSWVTQKDFRSAKWSEKHDEDGIQLVDWTRSGQGYRRLLQRLEDPAIDGAGLQEQDDGGLLIAGVGKAGFDVSKKSETWKRGYYEVLMGAGRAAEHLDGWVRDKTRNIAFPGTVVIGPSNPSPRPVPPGAKVAPREEDCEIAFEAPETYYMRILTTHGFTEKQRIDAALAYGTWLDYKGTSQTALEMYKWALDIATSSAGTSSSIIDPTTGVIKTENPSANVLSATTALALHHTLNSNLSVALPMFLSVLRARRSMPEAPATVVPVGSINEGKEGWFNTLVSFARGVVSPPSYPSSAPDGTEPLFRTPKERCEEAGIMTYVGEILYASKSSRTSREDGLAWTREAVDLAEEELRKRGIGAEAEKTCRQCLKVGLNNWSQMVQLLSEQEQASKSEVKGGGWLGFGGSEQKDIVGRWESEEQVVKDRIRRSKDVMS